MEPDLVGTPTQHRLQYGADVLDDIAGITPSDGTFLVGEDSSFVPKSDSTARDSLSLGAGDNVRFNRLGLGIGPSGSFRLTCVGFGLFYSGAYMNGIAGDPLNVSGKGVFWVKNTSPHVPMFSDDVSSHNQLQYWSQHLEDITDIVSPSTDTFIVYDGNNFVGESGSDARDRLGLAIGSDVQGWDTDLQALANASGTGVYSRTGAGTGATSTGTDNRVARWNGTDQLQDSGVEISDGGAMYVPGSLYFDSMGGDARLVYSSGTMFLIAPNDFDLQDDSNNTILRYDSGIDGVGVLRVPAVGTALAVGGTLWVDDDDLEVGDWARFDDSGQSLQIIGPDSPETLGSPKAALHVEDHADTSGQVYDSVGYFYNDSQQAGRKVLVLEFDGTSPAGAAHYLEFRASGSQVGSVEGDGSGGVSYTCSLAHPAQALEQVEPIRRPDGEPDRVRVGTGGDAVEWWPGYIVVSTGEVIRRQAWHVEDVTGRPVLVDLARQAADPRVKGVLSANVVDPERPETARRGVDPTKPQLRVHAVGDGAVWVTDINGPVDNGDLITSSPVAGHGQRQDDDLLHSYTVAKCTEAVDWSAVTDTIEHDGEMVKRVLIACMYHGG